MPLVLREVNLRKPCGHMEKVWLLFSGDVAVAEVKDPGTFLNGYLMAGGQPLVVETAN